MLDNVLLFVVICSVTILLKKILFSEPNHVQFQFYFVALYFYTSLVSFVMLPFFFLRPKDVRNAKAAAWVIKHITKLYKVKWVLRNGEILAEERGAVIVSNHQSSLDILGIFNVWEVVGKMTIIAKSVLFYVWPFGLASYLAGVVFINRRDTKGAYKQLQITADVMVKNKTKIWLFPEGTRNKDYTKFLPFKRGAFSTAVHAQVPIIPVLFSPYYFINAKKNIFNKGHVIISCLEPVPTKGLTAEDVPDLMQRIHDMMLAEYKKLSKEVLSDLPSDYPHTTVG